MARGTGSWFRAENLEGKNADLSTDYTNANNNNANHTNNYKMAKRLFRIACTRYIPGKVKKCFETWKGESHFC